MTCYICEKELEGKDLAINMTVQGQSTFGFFRVDIVQHYVCGLDLYLSNLVNAPNIVDHDKARIEEKLMEILQAMNKGKNVQ
jgi:hypothetical protein